MFSNRFLVTSQVEPVYFSFEEDVCGWMVVIKFLNCYSPILLTNVTFNIGSWYAETGVTGVHAAIRTGIIDIQASMCFAGSCFFVHHIEQNDINKSKMILLQTLAVVKVRKPPSFGKKTLWFALELSLTCNRLFSELKYSHNVHDVRLR